MNIVPGAVSQSFGPVHDAHGAASPLEVRVAKLEQQLAADRRSGTAIVVSGGALDHVLSALILATTSAALGEEVHIFFSFWAISALRKPGARTRSRVTLIDRVLRMLLPKGARRLTLSRMHWGGAGTAMMRGRMKSKGIPDCDELLDMAKSSGVRLSVCEMTMDLMGLTRDDLIDYPDLGVCGAATFLAIAQKSATTLII